MNLHDTLKATIDAVIDRYWDVLPLDVVALSTKTLGHYLRVLERAVKDLYDGKITENDFTDTMISLLDEQLRKAWNQGMRENGLDPQQDMTEEWEAVLQNIIDIEFDALQGFMDAIVEARETGGNIDALLARAQLWANRYNEVVNTAILETSEPKDKLEWQLGATEEHCETCAALNGLVATAREWEESGFHPQEPPNNLLTCGGWRCDCRLVPTDKRRSPKVLDTLIALATG